MTLMADRLAVMLEEQRSFVADASHQLRTPLTAMRLRLENLQARMNNADAEELDAAIDETTRLATLVADLLQLARADEAQPVVEVDLANLALQRTDTWSALAELSGVTLRVEGAEAPVLASAAAGAVEQILDNTLDNALNVSPSGSTIVVRVAQQHDRCTLSVSDQGPGLSDEDKQRATRRFWRQHPTATGTGLGLPIAVSLARASGGSLTLADAPEGGLQVVLTLPH